MSILFIGLWSRIEMGDEAVVEVEVEIELGRTLGLPC